MDKIKLGIIGVGRMGTCHIENILGGGSPDFEVVAVADIDPARQAWAKKNIKDVAVFGDGMDLIDSGLVDAVMVEILHYDHPKYSIAAMEKGLHVICEKPAGVYTKQVREMNEVAAKCDVVFAMMFNQRTNPVYQKMRELVQSGVYGELRRVNWLITSWFRSQDYYEQGGWRATWKGEGGGTLINQCAHQLDLLQWICGMPEKVSAHMHLGKWHDIEVEDDVTAYMEFKNGATGVFISSTGDEYGTNRFEIQLDGARIIAVEDHLEVLEYAEFASKHIYKEGNVASVPVEAKPLELPDFGKVPNGHIEMLNNFGDAILGKGELIAFGHEGINGLELTNAMYLSSFLGKDINFPIDEDVYYDELMKRVATSRFEGIKPQDMDDCVLSNTTY